MKKGEFLKCDKEHLQKGKEASYFKASSLEKKRSNSDEFPIYLYFLMISRGKVFMNVIVSWPNLRDEMNYYAFIDK